MDDKNLGKIVTIHGSGIRETDKGEKSTIGEIGDTLMMGANKKSYIVPKGEIKPNTEKEKTPLQLLREEAAALGIEGADRMNTVQVTKALEDKKAALAKVNAGGSGGLLDGDNGGNE